MGSGGCFCVFFCFVLLLLFFPHFLCFCFSVSKSYSEVHVPHSDTMNIASVGLFCGLISFCKF